MALDVLDGNSDPQVIKSTVTTGEHITHHHVDSSALPTGASTEATMLNILAELKDDKQISESVWRDKNTDDYYIRRVTIEQDGGTVVVAWYDISGTVATPTIGDLVQTTSDTDYEIVSTGFRATAGGTGYSTGDRIVEMAIVNTKTATTTTTIWFNSTTNAVISAPSMANLKGENEKVLADSLIQLTAVNTVLGTTADASATTDAGTFSIVSLIKRLLEKWTVGLIVFGSTKNVQASTFNRPADTTAYSANDVISNSTSSPSMFTITDLARINNGTGYIVKIRLMTNKAGITPRIRVHLFMSSVTALNDNSQYTLLWANRTVRVTSVDLPALKTSGTGSDASEATLADLRIHFQADTSSKTLYAMLETLDAFTPDSGQTFFLEVSSDNN